MRRITFKPSAMNAMGANRANDARDAKEALVLPLVRSTAERVVELTDLVAELQARIEALEAKGAA